MAVSDASQSGTTADRALVPQQYNLPRVHRNAPPVDYDPLRASAEELDRYHLPRPPDGAVAPHALANWKRAMSPPLFFLQGDESNVTKLRAWGQQAAVKNASPPAQESSQNWSGAYVRSRDAGRFVLVEGTWIVPKPSPPLAGGPGAGLPPGIFGSSAWIGLDGHDPTSLSLPQIGTAQFVWVDIGGPVVSTYAWWQWWVRHRDDDAPLQIDPFPVTPGDLVYCRLEVLGLQQVNLFIKNQSSGAAVSFVADAPAPQNPPANTRDVVVEARTAEWILERPTVPASTQYFTLPNYGATVFYACNTVLATGAAAEERQLQQARFIRMTDWDDPNHRGQTVSTAVRQTDTSMLLYYRGNLP